MTCFGTLIRIFSPFFIIYNITENCNKQYYKNVLDITSVLSVHSYCELWGCLFSVYIHIARYLAACFQCTLIFLVMRWTVFSVHSSCLLRGGLFYSVQCTPILLIILWPVFSEHSYCLLGGHSLFSVYMYTYIACYSVDKQLRVSHYMSVGLKNGLITCMFLIYFLLQRLLYLL